MHLVAALLHQPPRVPDAEGRRQVVAEDHLEQQLGADADLELARVEFVDVGVPQSANTAM